MKRTGATLGLIAASAASSLATIVIDDFATGAYFRSISSGSAVESQAGGMLGGQRDTLLRIQTPGANPLLTLEMLIGGGIQFSSSAATVDGMCGLQWDGNGGAAEEVGVVPGFADFNDIAGLGMSFLGEDRFRVQFLYADQTMAIQMVVRSGGIDYVANHLYTYSVVNDHDDFLFSEFAGANMGAVQSVTVRFDPPTSGDFALLGVAAVPEPGSLAALALGALVLARKRRSR